jgi:hypothetical protein
MSTVSTLRISEETKARFDNAQRVLSYRKKQTLTQDETLSELLVTFEKTIEMEA